MQRSTASSRAAQKRAQKTFGVVVLLIIVGDLGILVPPVGIPLVLLAVGVGLYVATVRHRRKKQLLAERLERLRVERERLAAEQERRRVLQAQRAALQATRAREIANYDQMDPSEFEHALAYLCKRDGCTTARVVGGAGDHGADVIATTPDGRRMVIQAKRYAQGNPVGNQAIQIVNGTYRDAHKAQLAAIVTTSTFTAQARSFAAQVGIKLLDRNGLAAWASQTGPAPWH